MPAAAPILLALALSSGIAVDPGKGFASGFETILEPDLARDVRALSDPELEGRDTPSLGLERAAGIVEARFAGAGLVPAFPQTGEASFRRAFQRHLPEPDPQGCSLEIVTTGTTGGTALELGRDFVPVTGFPGEAEGEVAFAGYGIRSKTERYDDFLGLKLQGKIALVLEAEPRSDRKFEGPEISRAASLWDKIDALAEAGAAGVLAVRRPAVAPSPAGAHGKPAAAPGISFRYTWAEWNGVESDPRPKQKLPVLEVSLACAAKILGQDVEALADRIDRASKPVKASGAGRAVRMRSRTHEKNVDIQNLVGLLRGVDPALSGEFVVVGAHYDHVGVDDRGRIACGADDNASGVAGMLEIAEALAEAGPRRSVLFCAFAGEEDGLLGSHALCGDLPVPKEKIVAMINLDMIGRGDEGEVAVLGIEQNPSLESVLARARKLKPCGLRQVVVRQGQELFERSDHFSFHKIGVPALFFFEGLPIDLNKDYHTWRDTAEKLDTGKMLNTTRFVYNAAWILTEDDERPPPPRG